MIAKMNRLSVLLYHGEKEEFLNKLRDVGVVHIESADKELNAKSAAINSDLMEVERVISEIKRTYKNFSGSCDLQAADAVKKYVANSVRIETINNEISSIVKEKNRFEPWGDVSNKTLQKLKENGVYVSLFELSAKEKSLLENVAYEVVKETSSNLWVAVVGTNEPITIDGKEPDRKSVV
jgi:V/A-type H+-transporting ATPase subunit I